MILRLVKYVKKWGDGASGVGLERDFSRSREHGGVKFWYRGFLCGHGDRSG